MNWKHKLAFSIFNHGGDFSNYRKPGLRILAYHSVGTSSYRDEMNLYDVSPSMLESQLSALTEYEKVRVTSMNDDDENDSRQTSVVFTFDDGYLDNLKHVAPLMEKYQKPWHIFVVSDFVKNKNKGFMSPEDLKELSKSEYVTIGSHGKSHTHLSKCNDEELVNELSYSKKYLEDLLGKDVDSVSYPYGAVVKRVVSSADKSGYLHGCSSYPNINLPNRNRLCLCRTPIFSYDNQNTFMQKIFGAWDWMRFFSEDPLLNDRFD